MTKADLIGRIATQAELTKANAERALSALLDALTGALKGGDKVAIPNFGTFTVSERAARTGKNPQTGAAIQIPAAKAPKFKAGKGLKDAVN